MLKRIKGFTLIELLIVVAIIAILAAIAVPNFLEAQTRSKVSRVKADQRTLATALEAYYIDNNSYPAQDTSGSATANHSYNQPPTNLTPRPTKGYVNLPTFRMKSSAFDPLFTLTTPVAYLTSLFGDPFADTKTITFNYSVNRTGTGVGWILWSYGPDTDENDFTNSKGTARTSPAYGGDIELEKTLDAGVGSFVVGESYYNPSKANPSNDLITYGTYDPSNGTTANGDVYKLKG